MPDAAERIVVVVALAARDGANVEATSEDAAGGTRTFTVGLSPTGNPPATHYWCNWQLSSAARARIRSRLEALPQAGTRVRVFVLSSFDPLEATPRPDDILVTTGLQRVRRPGA